MFFLVLLMAFLGACAPLNGELQRPAADSVWNETDRLSAEEKIGQLFVVSFRNGESQEEIEKTIADYNVGGIILFGENVVDKEQVKSLIKGAKNAAAIPLLVAVDEEGGVVSRLGKLYDEKIPPAAELAESGKVYDAYREISRRLIELGFNTDFAPVADVDSNPLNPVIGERAFSSDAEKAASAVAESVRAFTDGGIVCALKHFPGHGDTTDDTHKGVTVSGKTLEEMARGEFLPFEAGIRAGAPIVMAAHITAPAVSDFPASLSREIITDILRGQLGFDGVVITDALDMRAVTDIFPPGEACYAAFKAGADFLLMPEDFPAAFDFMLDCYKNGKITDKELNAALNRILKLKQKF